MTASICGGVTFSDSQEVGDWAGSTFLDPPPRTEILLINLDIVYLDLEQE
jgi:hypothetical protein